MRCGEYALRSVGEHLRYAVEYDFGGDLADAIVAGAGREGLAVVAGAAGEKLAAPEGEGAGTLGEATAGISGAEEGYDAGGGDAGEVEGAGIVGDEDGSRVEEGESLGKG